MYPRANTLGLVIKDNVVLLEEQEDEDRFYYRPIGGKIEFGEKSEETLIREFKEELGVEIDIIRYVSCIENIFKIGENLGHEITQIYLAEFMDKTLYEQDTFTVTERTKISCAKWIPIKDLISGGKVVYPTGLTDLLQEVAPFHSVKHLPNGSTTR